MLICTSPCAIQTFLSVEFLCGKTYAGCFTFTRKNLQPLSRSFFLNFSHSIIFLYCGLFYSVAVSYSVPLPFCWWMPEIFSVVCVPSFLPILRSAIEFGQVILEQPPSCYTRRMTADPFLLEERHVRQECTSLDTHPCMCCTYSKIDPMV